MSKDLVRWNIRASAVYALGIWTMIGSYAFFKYRGRYEVVPVEQVDEPENPNKHVYESSHYKSVIMYKKDFVPYTTRIYNFIKSFGDGPGPGEGEK